MKVGTIELPVKEKKTLKRRTRVGGGFGAGGGTPYRGGGDDGGGGNNYKGNSLGDVERSPIGKYRVSMFFLLLIVLMTFGTLASAYLVISSKGGVRWQPAALPSYVWFSTVFILASSVAYHFAQKATNDTKQAKIKKWLLATVVFGGMFILSQILVWHDLAERGFYLKNNSYAGFFYALTAIHAFHVIGGVIALGYLVRRNRQKTFSREETARRKTLLSVVGWYWHSMGGLWLLLLGLLNYWK